MKKIVLATLATMCLSQFTYAAGLFDLIHAPSSADVDEMCTDEFLDQHQESSWVWYLCALQGSSELQKRLRARITQTKDRTLAAIADNTMPDREEELKLFDVLRISDNHQAAMQWVKDHPNAHPGALLAFAKLAANIGYSLSSVRLLGGIKELSETEVLEVLVATPNNLNPKSRDIFLAIKRHFEVKGVVPNEFSHKLFNVALNHAHIAILSYLIDTSHIRLNPYEVEVLINKARLSAAYPKRALGFASLGYGPLMLRLAVKNCETQAVVALLGVVMDFDAIVEAFRNALTHYGRDSDNYAGIVDAFVQAMISCGYYDNVLKARLLACAVLEVQTQVAQRLIAAGADPSHSVAISRKEEPKSAHERALSFQRSMRAQDPQRPLIDKLVEVIMSSGQVDPSALTLAAPEAATLEARLSALMGCADGEDQCTGRSRRLSSTLIRLRRRVERYPSAAAAAADSTVFEAPRRPHSSPDVYLPLNL